MKFCCFEIIEKEFGRNFHRCEPTNHDIVPVHSLLVVVTIQKYAHRDIPGDQLLQLSREQFPIK